MSNVIYSQLQTIETKRRRVRPELRRCRLRGRTEFENRNSRHSSAFRSRINERFRRATTASREAVLERDALKVSVLPLYWRTMLRKLYGIRTVYLRTCTAVSQILMKMRLRYSTDMATQQTVTNAMA